VCMQQRKRQQRQWQRRAGTPQGGSTSAHQASRRIVPEKDRSLPEEGCECTRCQTWELWIVGIGQERRIVGRTARQAGRLQEPAATLFDQGGPQELPRQADL
jgi:hypothetical protein